MATQHWTDEADIQQRIDRGVAAVRAMDLENVMALYAPDIVSFDIVPPLRYVGASAKRKAWVDALAMYQRPLGDEIRDDCRPHSDNSTPARGATIAADLGYFDQARFVREFRSFTAITPTQYAQRRSWLPSHIEPTATC